MAAPENIKAGFVKERDVFADQGIRYATPLVSLDKPKLVPKQLFQGLREILPGLRLAETARAVAEGYRPLQTFNDRLRRRLREVLEWCAPRTSRACSSLPGRTTWTRGSATRSRPTFKPT